MKGYFGQGCLAAAFSSISEPQPGLVGTMKCPSFATSTTGGMPEKVGKADS
jgi:hypothetical protein